MPEWLTPDQFATRLGVHHTTVRRWIAARQLRAVRRGRLLRIARTDADAFEQRYVVTIEPIASIGGGYESRAVATA